MRCAAKIGFATLVVAMLSFHPPEACARLGDRAAQQPAHPCCPTKPAPVDHDCAKPCCLFMDTHIVPNAIAPSGDVFALSIPPAHSLLSKYHTAAVMAPMTKMRIPRHLYVTHHQFLI